MPHHPDRPHPADTVPLPVYRTPAAWAEPAGTAPAPARSVRILEAVVGLLSAGLLMLGLALTAAIFLAPVLVGGSGLEAATGPRPDRALVQLAVGATGEAARLFRHRLPTSARVAIAALVLIAGCAALWWGWWR